MSFYISVLLLTDGAFSMEGTLIVRLSIRMGVFGWGIVKQSTWNGIA